ncbi:MAG: ABC transporter transmembrane domain-containing protein, partial [Candidatus Marinimicrobia bacterium]|nr:ABC transporter transmembrane domain-containing protein [Candidatus Neomarinimicrobiota bacterium]
MNIKLKESPLFLSGHLGELAILVRIIKLCLRYKKLIILGILGVIGVITSQLWIPFLLGTSIDTVYFEIRTGGDDFSPLWILSIYIILASVLRGIFHFLLQYNGEKIANAMSAELRSKFHHKLQSQTYKYHDRIHSGNLMSRGIMDIEGVKMFVTTGLLRTFEIVSLMVAGSFLLLRTDLHIGLLSL